MADSTRRNGGPPALGIGVGWRPELALAIERYPSLGFVELLAEDLDPRLPLPGPVENLLTRGCGVVPHGVSLSLGGAERPNRDRLRRLEQLSRVTSAPLVSEHLAFVRANGIESGHLLPVPPTWDALTVVCENVRAAQAALSVPLALENIAALFEWPGGELGEADFLAEVLERTGALLLLDVSNLYANAVNFGWDVNAYLRRLPLERIAYLHISGGELRGGRYHDTHGAPIARGALALLERVCRLVSVPGVMLERDSHFPTRDELHAELDAVRDCLNPAVQLGSARC